MLLMKKCDKEELIVFLEKENSTEQEVVKPSCKLQVAINNAIMLLCGLC